MALGAPADEPRPAASRGRALAALLRLLPQASPPLTIGLGLGTLVLALITPALAVVSGALLTAVPPAAEAGWSSPAGSHLARLAVLEVALFTLSQLGQPILGVTAENLARRAERAVRTRLLRAAGAIESLADLEDPRTQDRIANAKAFGAAEVTAALATVSVARLAAAWAAALLSAALLATFRWYLAALLLTAYLGVFVFMWTSLGRALRSIEEQTQDMRRAAYLRDLAITPGAAKEVRVFALLPWIMARFDEVTDRAVRASRGMRGHMAVTGALAALILLGVDFFVTMVIGGAALDAEISLGRMLVVLQAAWGIGQLLTLDSSFLQIGGGASTIVALEELEARVALEGGRPQGAALPGDDTVRFEGVSFRYPGQSHDVLSGLDLELAAGRSLAIVGENGAGKTTLVKLLAGLYQPTAGRITVGGVPLHELDQHQWRQRIAAIFQDFTRFELTLRENVGFGALALVDDDVALARAAERAGATALVDELPDGWSTVLSRGHEGGIEPSGGQWQRIALARAFVAVEGGARVLVLDEPTANLDVRAEAELYDRFLELTAGLTTVLISHRFSTVRRADRIAVLEHGGVTEDGSHDTLLAQGGRYAAMFSLQASRFDDGVGADGDGVGAENDGVGGGA